MSLPDVMSTPMADQADLVKAPVQELQEPEPSTPNSTKKKRKPRATLTPQHMNALIASYRMHYALYSQARESVTQLVPSSVWKKVYNDFIGLYPDATSFDNEHLKARVRNALKEMESNNSVAEMVQKNEQILKRLKMTGASPLMQQILWRNHNAEISQQKAPVISAVPIQLPSTAEKTSEPAASVTASQPVTASTPTSDEPVVDSESQTMQQSQPSSVQPSQSLPNSSESDSDDGANRNAAAPNNHVADQKSAPVVPNMQQEPLTARPAPPAPAMGKKALMQTQTSALCKMSVDFNTACAGIMEFLEIHKAKAKQEENKVMLANYEKAREMGVITFEEMKSKARKLLDM